MRYEARGPAVSVSTLAHPFRLMLPPQSYPECSLESMHFTSISASCDARHLSNQRRGGVRRYLLVQQVKKNSRARADGLTMPAWGRF